MLWRLDDGEATSPWVLTGGFLLLSSALAAGSAELYRPRPAGLSAGEPVARVST
jgi:hypothetical protein